MSRSLGARRLGRYLKGCGLTQKALAEALGVSTPTVHDWLSGTKVPRPPNRAAIRVFTDGEVLDNDWSKIALSFKRLRELPKDKGGTKKKRRRPKGSADGPKDSRARTRISARADAQAAVLKVGENEAAE